VKRLAAIALIWSAAVMPPLSGSSFDWRLPPGFPVPLSNMQSQEKFELGRRLFYDRRLSFNETQSCADCHQQRFAFTDGRARAVGSTGQTHSRNSMTLTNAAYNAMYTWDNDRIRSLEQQARVPMFNERPVELGVKSHEKEIVARLRNDPAYDGMFRQVFRGERRPVNINNIASALAAFERALISGRSPYDRLVYGGDEKAMSASAWRGMGLFFSARAGCSECHRGFNFSGAVRHTGKRDEEPHLVSNGVTSGKFRVPTLRNVALTAPYMHDGGIATLAQVISRYSDARRLSLTSEEQSDLLAFLDSLTDQEFVTDPRFGPPLPSFRAPQSARNPGGGNAPAAQIPRRLRGSE
jgi:cytochrome c peroxidase